MNLFDNLFSTNTNSEHILKKYIFTLKLIFTLLILLTLININYNSPLLSILSCVLATIFLIITFLIIKNYRKFLRNRANSSEYAANRNEGYDKELVKEDYYINEKKHFISLLSHDMRSPLSSIILVSHMIRNGKKYPDIDHFLEMIEKSAKKELDMMGMLLALMRADLEQPETFKQVLLKELIDESVMKVNETINTEKVDFKINVADGLLAYANPYSFPLVLNNIIANAIKFSEPGKTVEIISGEDELNTFIEITDFGKGFDPGTESRFFDLVTIDKQDIAKESPELIGLYFCNKIMQNHNGTIHAFSDGLGKGAAIKLKLPKEIIN